MSNVESSDVNDIPETWVQAAIEGEKSHNQYIAKVTRWLSGVLYDELLPDLNVANRAEWVIRDIAKRIEDGKLQLPEALK